MGPVNMYDITRAAINKIDSSIEAVWHGNDATRQIYFRGESVSISREGDLIRVIHDPGEPATFVAFDKAAATIRQMLRIPPTV